jgi:hypothetical protein
MDPQQAFSQFVNQVLSSEKARRLTAIAATTKGQRKVLEELCHQIEYAVRPAAIRLGGYNSLWDHSCFVFHTSVGFGAEFPSVREAYDKMTLEDGWLILLKDASAGVHRPESRWDDEKLLVA